MAAAVLCAALMLGSGCASTGPGAWAGAGARAWEPRVESSTRERSMELLRTALDREALYTIAWGLKPMSTGFWRGRIAVAEGGPGASPAPDVSELERTRAALAQWRCGELYADVQVFEAVHEGSRTVEAYVIDRAALARVIERDREFWLPLGVTPTTHPAEVLAITERLPRSDRWRAYGYLFGYPRYAVDFFVQAGERAAASGGEVGPGRDREFFHVETFQSLEGRFTWAVPMDHEPREEDLAIEARAGQILTRYLEIRGAVRSAGSARSAIAEVRRATRMSGDGCEVATGVASAGASAR